MIRAAIYARFSTERQDVRSISDQAAICRAYAERQAWRVVDVYSDAAQSGASEHGRDAFARLVADAERGLFDLIIAEDIERLSRNLADIERFRERMEFIGVAIRTIADGEVTQLNATLKGLGSAMMLKGHAQRVRNRQAEHVRQGLAGGGLTYGYAPGPTKGSRVIVEAEAAIVRRIFAEYDAGRSPREIAARLNADDVRPPRGRDWIQSAINGNPARGSGILANALYDGRLIWNRVAMRKDPRTGKRVSRANPPDQWISVDVPALRIVPAELFARVQAAKIERGKARPERARRPRHLLAGLLRCGCCGSAMSVAVGRRIYCSRRKEGGRCANGRTYFLEPIERRVIAGLAAQLADPRAIERYLVTYRAERKRLAASAAGKRAALTRELAQVERAIGRVVDQVAAGTLAEADVRSRMTELRRRREAAATELAATAPAPTVELHPAAIARYLAAVDDLAATLSRRLVAGDDQLAGALRELIASVVVHPTGPREPTIEVTGRLAKLTGAAELFPQSRFPNSGSGGRI
jgi:site-specific DNA recombinase